MTDAQERNDKSSRRKEPAPTGSFNSLPGGPDGRIGSFQLEIELGGGGMGVVYLGHDTELDRPVAIKSLPGDLTGNSKALSRLQREARCLAIGHTIPRQRPASRKGSLSSFKLPLSFIDSFLIEEASNAYLVKLNTGVR